MSLASGDTDGDGDADVLVGGTTTVQLYQNEVNLGFKVACAKPGGAITASGSDLVTSNTATLHLTGAEASTPGYFINSWLNGSLPGVPITPGGGVSGQVCIGGSGVIYGRHSSADEVFATDSNGDASLTLDLDRLRNPRNLATLNTSYVAVAAGETWYWQAWYRKGVESEFSDAIGVTFR